MQRMISHTPALPSCTKGHPSRHMHDLRGLSCGGGHHVECACSRTNRYSDFDDALSEWCARNGHPAPLFDQQRVLPLEPFTGIDLMRHAV